jgi:hypothetical protein
MLLQGKQNITNAPQCSAPLQLIAPKDASSSHALLQQTPAVLTNKFLKLEIEKLLNLIAPQT